ncbi:MAG: hypothetical protein JW699_02410 [Chitinispirillaceae bacterium]|nr:hypothetical protein [Chitinispirillaceae bacterium]
MHLCKRRSLLTLPAVFCLTLVCSGLDDSTDLGAGVIEDVYPDQVTIGKHLRRFMDSSLCDSSFSLPGQNDTGFGIHYSMTNSFLVVGDSAGDTAAGFVRFGPLPDTGSTRFYDSSDVLTQIVLRFSRYHGDPAQIEIRHSQDSSCPSKPSDTAGCPVIGTLNFTHIDSASDTISEISLSPDSALARPIFTACTTTSKDTAYLNHLSVFGFISVSLDHGIKTRLKYFPQMVVNFRRKLPDTTRDTGLTCSYYAYHHWYVAVDSIRSGPAMSYAPKRTAVFRYTTASLWAAIDTERAQVVSAVFQLQGPDSADTADIQYFLLDSLYHNGTCLDSLFKAAPAVSVPGTARLLANVLSTLQDYSRSSPRPPVLYLYLRYAEDVRQTWRQAVWNSAPLLTAIIAVP